MAAPYIHARYKEATDTGSVIAVTVANIKTDLVAELAVEYAMRPVWDWIKENKPFSVKVDVGDYNLINPGHIYDVALTVGHDFVFTAVLKYVDYDGFSHTIYDSSGLRYEGLDGTWHLAQCSVCKGIHTTEYHSRG